MKKDGKSMKKKKRVGKTKLLKRKKGRSGAKRPDADIAGDAHNATSATEKNSTFGNIGIATSIILERAAEARPYCESKDFVKRGWTRMR